MGNTRWKSTIVRGHHPAIVYYSTLPREHRNRRPCCIKELSFTAVVALIFSKSQQEKEILHNFQHKISLSSAPWDRFCDPTRRTIVAFCRVVSMWSYILKPGQTEKFKPSSIAKFCEKHIQSIFTHEIALLNASWGEFCDPTRCTIVAVCRVVLPRAIRCEVTFSNLAKLNKIELSSIAKYCEKHIQSIFTHEITLLNARWGEFSDPTRCTIVAFCRVVLPRAIRYEFTFSNLAKVYKIKLSSTAKYYEKHIQSSFTH